VPLRFSFGIFCFLAFAVSNTPAEAANPSSDSSFHSVEVHPVGGKAGFTLMNPAATGVTFTNRLESDAYLTNSVAHNGSGVAIGDVDGDGWQDIYLCNLGGPNRLYRNLGNWRFEEMEIGEAVCVGQLSTGATFADVDGDGDLDLLVNGIAAGTRLFLNDGKGRFSEMKDSGLSRTASATSMALADIDGDGDLDLYCTHYIDVMHLFDPTTRFSIMKRDGKWVVLKVNDQPTTMPNLKDRFEALPDGKVRELPEADGFYRNDGKGHFTPIQSEPGIFTNEEGKPVGPYRDWGLAVMFRDLNGDGAPDIYVCNDNVSPDRIWINSGKGTFRAIDQFAFRHTSRSSMGVDFGDINRDGIDDIIVVDMLARRHEKRLTQLVRDLPDRQDAERIESRPQYNRNTLFFGRPDGSYEEAALMAGVAASDWTWCPILLDVDLDGYEDLLVSNGFEFDVMDQDAQEELRNPKNRFTREQLKRSLQFRPHWPTQNAAFRNRRDGTFEPMSKEWGFDQSGVSYGMALGDLDGDGDLDVVVNNLNTGASLYRNDAMAPRIAVRLHGLAPNTQGIGAKIRLVGPSITQSQEMICGGRYLSGDQGMRIFAADPIPIRLEVKWRDGKETTITNLQANRIYEVYERNSDRAAELSKTAPELPFFRDVSSLLNHVHAESFYDDWSRQALLPRRLSRLGPGVSWFDINGDGWEDLIIGAARGDKLAIYTNDQHSSFHLLDGAPPSAGDQAGVIGWPDGKGNRKLLVGISNYEMGVGQESIIATYSLTNLAAPAFSPAGKASIGSLALADIDGDGDLDLFVGGRFRPGRYPEPTSSAVWLNEDGKLRFSSEWSKPFESIGLVSGATFADLDGDGRPDLALALEWGPVRVFRNANGHFEEMTTQFADRKGWWSGITAGDFDGDGKMDLAVGNWGGNSIYELYRPGPLRIFYDSENPQIISELIEAWQPGNAWVPIRSRLALEAGFPELKTQFSTHEAFSKATVQGILGSRYEKTRFVEANELESGVFLNRGSHFEWVPFPREAQVAPVFSLNVGDFDGDGIEDLFLSQNFFGNTSDLSRDDAGRGLWLRGKGNGTFTAVDGSLSGIKIYGEQRGAALADFNHDGRVDLAVGQNNGSTKLYWNERAKPGLHVILAGPPGNPEGIGAQLRVIYPDARLGPCRTVQAGSGYWSQDAATQVLGCSQSPSSIWIRWPGGKEEIIKTVGNLQLRCQIPAK
jgi:hypothetical protein